MLDLSRITLIGFDLDGTLYQRTPDIDNRIRTEIARHLHSLSHLKLQSIPHAREYLEQQYALTHSCGDVLRNAGVPNVREVMEACQMRADVVPLITPNPALAQMLSRMQDRCPLYLLTSSPTKIGMQKLERIGIDPAMFTHRFFLDTPGMRAKADGSAYHFVIERTGVFGHQQVYVGDDLNLDILPAQRAGMQTIVVRKHMPEASLSCGDILDVEQHLMPYDPR